MIRLSRPPADEAEEAAADNPLHDATWLYSYADLMTQLLIFAILTVTVGGLKEPAPPVAEPAPAPVAEAPAPEPAKSDLDRTVEELDRFVADAGLGAQVAVDRGADRVAIRMKSQLLFQEGQATLGPRAEEVLAGLVQLVGRIPNALRVEGHTDDVPMTGTLFPSNWELSTARAISVVRYLEEHGVPAGRLAVAGYGEFRPIVPNDGAERRALNRRVELVVLGEAP